MALIKTHDQREIEMLQKVEREIEKQERRKRINHLLVAGLGILSILGFVGGHLCGRHCERKHHHL